MPFGRSASPGVVARDAERLGTHSHAERGNDDALRGNDDTLRGNDDTDVVLAG